MQKGQARDVLPDLGLELWSCRESNPSVYLRKHPLTCRLDSSRSNVTGDVWVASLVAGRRDELVRLVITEAVDLMVWSLERHFIVARLCQRLRRLSVPPNRVMKCVESMRTMSPARWAAGTSRSA